MADAVKTFNSPIETGMRALILLAESYPAQIDLQRLLEYDYIMVHTGDVDGPPSIHLALLLRSGELLVRRQLIERGLMLMISRGLVSRRDRFPRGLHRRHRDRHCHAGSCAATPRD